ncbi:MAG: hypothetical protein FJ368_05415, partial [Pelagibacterales bacterium]|nr:hypothetical protein [Pelagibacterales bacterium]
GNNITALGAEKIATALEKNNTLTSLDLGHNNITDLGAESLATIKSILNRNKKLVETNKTLASPPAQETELAEMRQKIAQLEEVQVKLEQEQNQLNNKLEAEAKKTGKISAEEIAANQADEDRQQAINEQLAIITAQIDLMNDLTNQRLNGLVSLKAYQELEKLVFKSITESQLLSQSLTNSQSQLQEATKSINQFNEQFSKKLSTLAILDLAELEKLPQQVRNEIASLDDNAKQYLSSLNLNANKINKLNQIDDFKLEDLANTDFKAIFKEIEEGKKELVKIKNEAQEALEAKYNNAFNNPSSVAARTAKLEPEFKDYVEQKHLAKQDEKVKEVALAIEKKFNDHFVSATVLQSGKIQATTGKMTQALGIVSGLVGDLPGANIAGMVLTSAVGYKAGQRREDRYQNLSDILPNSSLQEAVIFAEKIGRKVALTEIVQINSKAQIQPTKTGFKNYIKKHTIGKDDFNSYKESLAESCLETIKNGEASKWVNEQTKNNSTTNKDPKDLTIEGVIAKNDEIKNKTIFNLSQQKIEEERKKQPPSNQELLTMMQEMRGMIESQRSEIDNLKEITRTQGAEIIQLKQQLESEKEDSKKNPNPNSLKITKTARLLSSQNTR